MNSVRKISRLGRLLAKLKFASPRRDLKKILCRCSNHHLLFRYSSTCLTNRRFACADTGNTAKHLSYRCKSSSGARDPCPQQPICPWYVEVDANGSTLSLSFTDRNGEAADNDNDAATATSLFHAAWLWSNDPTYVHPSSGQRMRSPSTYFAGWKLQQAKVFITDDVDDVISTTQENDNGSTAAVVVRPCHPRPAKGSMHPIGTVYKLHCTDDSSSEIQTLLRVEWVHTTSGEMIESFYDVDWLWQWRYDHQALEKRCHDTVITKDKALGRGYDLVGVAHHRLAAPKSPSSSVPTGESTAAGEHDHDDGDHVRHELLQAIFEQGAAMVQGAPHLADFSNPEALETASTDMETFVGDVARSLSGGGISHGSLYGDIFHVVSMGNAHNIAYTNVALPPHQDLAYYESKPGLQLLHCVANGKGVQGGESTLIDGVAAARELARLAPDLFQILLQCHATFLKQRQDADMTYRRPHIEQEASTGSIIRVNWSPPFEGPACIPPNLMQDYYVARAAYERMVDNSLPTNQSLLPISPSLERQLSDYAQTFTWEKRLEPGEILIFSNQRMLHGRRGFQLAKDKDKSGVEWIRHLIGCYTNIDDTLNQFRLLRRERQQDTKTTSYVLCSGNGSSGNL